MGASLKLHTMVHRMIASYLRAVTTLLTTLSVASAVSEGHVNLTFLSQLVYSLLGAFIGPFIVFLTEAADLLDGPNPPVAVNVVNVAPAAPVAPVPPKPDAGETTLMTILIVLGIVVLVLVILGNR